VSSQDPDRDRPLKSTVNRVSADAELSRERALARALRVTFADAQGSNWRVAFNSNAY